MHARTHGMHTKHTHTHTGGLEGQLRSAQRGEKQKQALNFAAAFSASSSTGSSGIGIDPNLLAAREFLQQKESKSFILGRLVAGLLNACNLWVQLCNPILSYPMGAWQLCQR
eukprot:1145038-Pelagomonas_calceolata.AAC.5